MVLTDERNIDNLVPFRVVPDMTHAAAAALFAGVDQDLQGGGPDWEFQGYAYLPAALEQGLVTMDEIDLSVRRVLSLKFSAGLFDYPMAYPERLALIGSREHNELNAEAARQSVTMIRNSR